MDKNEKFMIPPMNDVYYSRVISQLNSDAVGSNTECQYYPCHQQGQDCTFCYCPFYPCNDDSLGKEIIGRRGNKVWSCEKCLLPHHPKISAILYSRLKDSWPCSIDDSKVLFNDCKKIFFDL